MATLQELQSVISGFPRMLTRADFRKLQTSLIPPHMAHVSSLGALMPLWTVALVKGEYRVTGLRINITINPNNTWAVSSSISNPDILRHEQGHFDITGLIYRDFARKILNLSLTTASVVSAAGTMNTQNQYLRYVLQRYQSEIIIFGAQAETLLNRIQTNMVTRVDGIYDVQTEHGTNIGAQARWNIRLERIKTAGEDFESSLRTEGVI